MRLVPHLLLGITLAGCSAAAPPAQGPTALKATPSATAVAPNAAAPSPSDGAVEAPELDQEFVAAHVGGTFAVFDSQDGVVRCSHLAKCREAFSPASTYKIPHSMIALETGVIEGPDTVLPWDHTEYWLDAWNHDLSFRDAFRVSCLPCYRAVARKVGNAGEAAWLKKLGYGNADTSGVADKFWIAGGLRISPLEQIAFLRRFDGDQLPISARTADIVRDIMTLDVTERYVLRGKTGSERTPEEPKELYWFVGWLELGDRRIFFATFIDEHAPDIDAAALRRPLTERILESRGWM